LATVVEDWIQSAKRGLKKLIILTLFAGWTAGWGIILLIGWATESALALGVSLGAIGLGALAGGGWRFAVVRARRRLARRSLEVRLQLAGIAVTGNMRSMIELFDLVSRDISETLARPALRSSLGASLEASLDKTRGQIEALARAHVATTEDIRQLSAMPALDPVAARLSLAQTKAEELETSVQRIVEDVHRVSKKLSEVQGLLGSGAELGEQAPLEQAIADLEQTAQAYREMGS
jgi:hypothetical protein